MKLRALSRCTLLAALSAAWLVPFCSTTAAQSGDEAEQDEALSEDTSWLASEEPAGDGGAQAEEEAPITNAATASDDDLPTASIDVGFGATQRHIGFGTSEGNATLDTGLVPALQVALNARFGRGTFLGVSLVYQSSIFAVGDQRSPDPLGPSLSTTIQSHRVSAGLIPGLRLGSADDSATLGLFVGYGIRALSSVIELTTPRFSLHGPVFRLEFELPLLGATVVLRLAPELHVIVGQTPALRRLARTQSPGLAIGGEVGLRAYLGSAWAIGVSYRESHAGASSAWSTAFEDIERFAILSAIWRYN